VVHLAFVKHRTGRQQAYINNLNFYILSHVELFEQRIYVCIY